MNRLALSGTSTHAPTRLGRVDEMLDAHAMGARLQAAIGAGGRGRCHVLDAKYEPGVRCTVLYRAGDLLVRGDLLDEETGSADAFRPVVAPGVRLSRFPDDPDLPRLADVADPVALRDALRDALPGGGRILRCRVDLVRYRPAKRATLAVEVRGSSDPAPGRAQRFVVKSYHDGEKAAAVAAEAVLLDATVDPAAPLRFAPVRAHLPELSLVVQEHVAGVPLDEVIRLPGPVAERALRRAAVALAALHAQPVVSSRTRGIDKELARFVARSLRVAEVEPGHRRGTDGARYPARCDGGRRPPGVVGLVHGDCKPSQFLLRRRAGGRAAGPRLLRSGRPGRRRGHLPGDAAPAHPPAAPGAAIDCGRSPRASGTRRGVPPTSMSRQREEERTWNSGGGSRGTRR